LAATGNGDDFVFQGHDVSAYIDKKSVYSVTGHYLSVSALDHPVQVVLRNHGGLFYTAGLLQTHVRGQALWQ
jgi:hypothetical protein